MGHWLCPFWTQITSMCQRDCSARRENRICFISKDTKHFQECWINIEKEQYKQACFINLFNFLSALLISASPRIPMKDASALSSKSAQVGKLAEVWKQGLSSTVKADGILFLFGVLFLLLSFALFTYLLTRGLDLKEAGDSMYWNSALSVLSCVTPPQGNHCIAENSRKLCGLEYTEYARSSLSFKLFCFFKENFKC